MSALVKYQNHKKLKLGSEARNEHKEKYIANACDNHNKRCPSYQVEMAI